MAKLDLYTKQKPHEILLQSYINPAEEMIYYIPTECTVEEIELLTIYQIKIDKLADKKVNKKDEEANLVEFYNEILLQLLILFKRHQPELTEQHLRKIMTREEALQVWHFFIEQRQLTALKEAKEATVKKKAMKIN